MADGTHIEWTDATWNPITGCSVVSPGCTNCYAMKLAGTRLKHIQSREGLTRDTKAGPVWTGEVRLNEEWLDQPLKWKRPRKIFVCAHGDLFAENVPDEWIDRVFAVMALAPQHTFQVLTKRAKRMREYVAGVREMRRVSMPDGSIFRFGPWAHVSTQMGAGKRWPLPNVWLGVSAEDQVRADERIPDLLATPAAVRWVSAEPLLGPIDFKRIHQVFDGGRSHSWESALNGKRFDPWSDGDIDGQPKLDWIVAGGESGAGARPMHPAWARSIRDQCAAAGVPFLFKQWGAWSPGKQAANLSSAFMSTKPVRVIEHEGSGVGTFLVGKNAAGRLLDGIEHNGFPEVAA